MAANKKRADGLAVLTGLHNLDPNKQKPVEERPIEEKPAPQPEIMKEPKANVTPRKKKRAPGRPFKYDENEVVEVLGVRIPDYQMRFLEENCGRYGGKTGYIRHIIEEEMKRINCGKLQ